MSSVIHSGRTKVWGSALAVMVFLTAVSLMIPLVASGGGEDTLSNIETFESYGLGYDIQNSQGWQHEPAEIAIVTNMPHSGLDTPFVDIEDGPAYTNVLYVNGAVSNVYEYMLTNLVYVDVMIKPSVRTEQPDVAELGESPQQFLQVACYVNQLGQLVIYHSYRPSTYVRRWTTIPSPLLDTNGWNRLTFTFCYNQSPWMKDAYFMLQINGSEPVENASYGYKLPADNWFGPDNGPWFQTCNSQWFDENLGFTALYGWFRGVEIACQNLPTIIDNLSVTSPPPSGIPITVNDKAAVEGNP